MSDIFYLLDKNAIEYKGYFIDTFVIDYITIGDKKYDGFTKYTIRTKDGYWIADKIIDGEPHIKEFASLKDAKDFIDKKVKEV